jgi:hypothetical protein
MQAHQTGEIPEAELFETSKAAVGTSMVPLGATCVLGNRRSLLRDRGNYLYGAASTSDHSLILVSENFG